MNRFENFLFQELRDAAQGVQVSDTNTARELHNTHTLQRHPVVRGRSQMLAIGAVTMAVVAILAIVAISRTTSRPVNAAVNTCVPRVTVDLPTVEFPDPPRTGVDDALVPDHPLSAMICRYYGMSTQNEIDKENLDASNYPTKLGQLAVQQKLGPDETAELASSMNSAAHKVESTRSSSCGGFSDWALAYFTYDQGPQVVVEIDVTSNCGATNGHLKTASGTIGETIDSLLEK